MERTFGRAPLLGTLLLTFLLLGAIPKAKAQQSWLAFVIADEAPVYADMQTNSEVLTSLKKGAPVAVLFALQTSQGSWCKIRLQSERQDFGFVLCSQIRRGHAPSSAAAGATNAPVAECKELVDRLLEATGIKVGLQRFNKDFLDSFRAGFRRVGQGERAEILGVMQREFDVSVLDAGVRRGLLNRCDSQTYAAVFEALETPLVARMIRIEMESVRPEKGGEMRSYIASLRSNPPPPQRVALMQRLDRKLGGWDYVIDLSVDIPLTLASELTGQTPTQAQFDALRDRVAPQMRQDFLFLSLAMYRSVSDEDLQQYADLWASEPLREFNDTFRGVFQEVMETQSRAAGAELRAIAEARCSHATSHQ